MYLLPENNCLFEYVYEAKLKHQIIILYNILFLTDIYEKQIH